MTTITAARARAVHDLRTALGGILVLSAVVRRPNPPHKLRDALVLSGELASVATDVVATLALGEEERGAPPLTAGLLADDVSMALPTPEVEDGPVRLDEVAHLVVATAETSYEGVIVLVAEPLLVTGGQATWWRVLANLVDNACRAAGPTGEVLVTASSGEGTIEVAVADSGPGFGAGPAGTAGVGLGVVATEVLRHHGHVELRRASGGGALVRVVLPARSAHGSHGPGTRGTPGPVRT